jgi:uncharacterized membrane protein YphA (DoxX/SURF4 family)
MSMYDNCNDSPALQQRKDHNAVALALLRIAVGLFFVVFGQYKVFGSAFVQSGFRDYIQGFIRDGAYPFMLPVLQWILAHAATAMAVAVGYGELLIGISLMIGLFSRVAASSVVRSCWRCGSRVAIQDRTQHFGCTGEPPSTGRSSRFVLLSLQPADQKRWLQCVG